MPDEAELAKLRAGRGHRGHAHLALQHPSPRELRTPTAGSARRRAATRGGRSSSSRAARARSARCSSASATRCRSCAGSRSAGSRTRSCRSAPARAHGARGRDAAARAPARASARGSGGSRAGIAAVSEAAVTASPSWSRSTAPPGSARARSRATWRRGWGCPTSTPARCTAPSPSRCCASGADPRDEAAVASVAARSDLELRRRRTAPSRSCSRRRGRGSGSALREVSEATSRISAYPAVRARMVELQRASARKYGAVVEGRDIGTASFPTRRTSSSSTRGRKCASGAATSSCGSAR